MLQTLLQGTNSQPGPGTLTLADPVYGAPIYTLLWGFVGGAAWCLDWAALWARKRVFDIHYLPWYVVHPFVSALLGGATALLILAGLSAVAQIGQGSYQETMTLIAVLSVISFSVGVSTHYIWRKLDSTLRKALGEDSSKQNKAKDDDQDNDATVE